MTNEFTVTIFRTKIWIRDKRSPFFNFSDTCKFIFIRLPWSTPLPESGANNFRSLPWITATRATSRLPSPFAVPLAIISSLSLPSSLTVEELRGFKFAPRRANATRNWNTRLIRRGYQEEENCSKQAHNCVYKKGEKRNYFKNNFENEITNKRLYSQRASVNYERTAKNYNHLWGGKQVKKLVFKKKQS